MNPHTRALFAEVVRTEPVDLGRACLLLAGEADPDLSEGDVAEGLAVLDALAADARRDVPPGADAVGAAEGLRRALGERGGFAGRDEDYEDISSSLLPRVLVRRRGLPILLSVVWLEVAARLGVPAAGVGMPGHFVVAVGPPDAPVHVDPFAGGRLRDEAWLRRRVRAATGRDLRRDDLQPWDASTTLLRVLANVRALGSRMPDPVVGVATSLWATELSLLLPRHPLALRHERGLLLGRAGRFEEGATELLEFAEAVEQLEPEVASGARDEARALRARLN